MSLPRHLFVLCGLLLASARLLAANSAPTLHSTNVTFVLGYIPLDSPAASEISHELDTSCAVIKERLSALKIEAQVDRLGDRIRVQIPHASGPTRNIARKALAESGRVEFREVYPQPESPATLAIPEGYDAHQLARDDRPSETLWLKLTPAISPRTIKEAHPMKNPDGHFEVVIQFDETGRKQFAELTGRLADAGMTDGIRRRVAILANGNIVAAPLVRQAITGGEIAVAGNFSKREALQLCISLSAPVLPSILSETAE